MFTIRWMNVGLVKIFLVKLWMKLKHYFVRNLYTIRKI